ncbi:MAG: 2-C-methyl-D-erythritol 4-phosphate cytidylyltransferase [Bacteroidetes bacterium]|nr:2-C-methyl-D-erythritol 4-phosphate cytidylyltransferase [Bacteroidota bacterium]MBS1932815.1 2-C-methyl-D-erythritol 4-phosphate cytidylyltransferase [Bacteroidota bacterium]
MKKFAVIVAAGTGVRMGNAIPKQFLLINHKPILWYTLNTFLDAYDDMQIILVLHKDHLDKGKEIVDSFHASDRITITSGGETRFHSVKNGLQFVTNPSVVFVHDGVRCLASAALIHHCYEEAVKKGNAIPSVKPVDSLRIENSDGNTIVDRSKIHIIQTPQTFQSAIIKPAFDQPYQTYFTDEASVVEKTGVKINLIEGELTNIKITQPIDLVIAETLLGIRYEL